MFNSKSLLVIFLSSMPFLSITGCNVIVSNNNIQSNVNNDYKVIKGNVDFPDFEMPFKTKATLSNVAPKSVVSLSYPADYATVGLRNTVVATGLTDAKGNFTLNADVAFKPKAGDIFVLEATKRLGSAGYDNIALRTNVRWNGTVYESITLNSMLINSKTTALSIISNFNPTLLATAGTIGTMSVVNNVVVTSDINSNIKASDIDNVSALVDKALKDNKDPVASIVFSNGEYLIRSTKAENPLFTGCVGDPSTCNYVAPSVVPTPTPTATITPVPTPTATPTIIATPTPVLTPTPSPTDFASSSPSPSSDPSISPSPDPSSFASYEPSTYPSY